MKTRLLYVGMQYDYGDRRRGLSYEQRNFFDPLKRFCGRRDWEMVHYDFMARSIAAGQSAMTEELYDLTRSTDFAFLFAVLFDPDHDPYPEVFSRIGESGRTRTVHWFCDDHWKFDTYSRHLAPQFHFSCTTARSAVEKYAAAGLADRVIKTQWACNHHLYRPCDVVPDIDVSFVGMPHGNRRKVLAGLARAGISPEIFGFGWRNRPRLPFHRMVRLFSRSRINLNLSNASTESGQQIKGRNFEIPGAGGFQLSSDAENLTDYFIEDREIVIFRSQEELADKAHYYLGHEAQRTAIARRGRARVLAEHTWERRLADIFERMDQRRSSAFSGDAGSDGKGPMLADGAAQDRTKAPAVSVIIPCFNQAGYLAEAVDSVAAQTYRDLEVIIVDDGSTDDTAETAELLMERHPDLPISLIRQENAGLPAARNAGVAVSSGKFWLPLDADDRIAPDFVETCLKALAHMPDAGFAYTDIQHFGDLDSVFRLPAFDAGVMVHKNNIGCVCSLVRREAWEAVGGYDNCMREGYEDWDFWVRCIEKGWKGVRIPKPLFYYRKRGRSMLTDARRKHDALFARIVLNHPSLYTVEEISAAALTIRENARSVIEAPGTAPTMDHGQKFTVTYLIHSILGVTGGNQTLIRQANALVDRGHRVHIVTYSETPAWYAFKAGVIRVPAGEAMADFVPPSDVVIATYFLNAPELVRVDAPVKIYFAQGDQYVFGDDTPVADPSARAERHRLRRLCEESYRLEGVRFVANSYNLAATVAHRFGRTADAVLPPCRDLSVFKPHDRAPAPPWRILVVGPDARGTDAEPLGFKGIGDIRAALDLLSTGAPPFRVVRMSNTTADIFRDFPCEFHFKPADPKKTGIYGTAHILIYASHYDSCPLPPMEAMAAGAAVVCTATAGALEYCRHEENALLVPVAAPAAIADAARRIMADGALYRRLVAGGAATAAGYPQEREWNALESLLYRFAAGEAPAVAGTAAATATLDETVHPAAHAADATPSDDHGTTVAGIENGQEDQSMNAQHAITPIESGADAAFQEIKTLIDRQRFDAALAGLDRLLAEYPDHAEGHSTAGRLHHALGAPEKAESHLVHAARLAPDREDLQRLLADFYHAAQGRADKALPIYESLAASHPEDADLGLLSGHLSVSLHRFDAAGRHYRRVLDHHPQHPDAGRFLSALERHSAAATRIDEGECRRRHAQALQLAEEGRIDAAVAALAALTDQEPGNPTIHNDLGVLCYRSGDYDRAYTHYHQAAALAPEDLTFQRNLADFLHVVRGEVAEALEIYVSILARRPEDVETLMTTGHICASLSRFDDAAHFYGRVLDAEPWNADARRFLEAAASRQSKIHDPEALRNEAAALAANGDHAGAAAVLESALAEAPDHAGLHSDLGALRYAMGDNAAALNHLESAARLSPENLPIRRQLADFYHSALGRVADALAIYDALADACPEDEELLLLAGHLSVAEGRFDAAEDRYRQILRVAPWHADAGRYLDALGRKRAEDAVAEIRDPDARYQEALDAADGGDSATAMKILEGIVSAHPDHAVSHNDLGVLRCREGDFERAITHYRTAVSLAPDHPVFRKNLADAYAAGPQRYEEALEIYVNLLAADPYDVDALLATGQICLAVERPGDAEHFFSRVLEAEPWNAEARNLLDSMSSGGETPASVDADELMAAARELAEAGDEDAALDMIRRLLGTHPDHAAAHNDAGVLHYRRNDLTGAETHYTRAVALDPSNPVFQKNLADFYGVALGRYEAALEIYVNLLAADPYDVESLMGTGHICRLLERFDDAAHFFERALEAEPWHEEARRCLDAARQRPLAAAR